tara:strand:- start:3684 stop:3983 length:300 start_codon:yes stop_codon:yes gene_type:complete
MNSLTTKMTKDLMTDHSIGTYNATDENGAIVINFTRGGIDRNVMVWQKLVTNENNQTYAKWFAAGSFTVNGETRAKTSKCATRFHDAAAPIVKWARQAV